MSVEGPSGPNDFIWRFRDLVSRGALYIGGGLLLIGTNPDFIIDKDRTLTVDFGEFSTELDQTELSVAFILVAALFGALCVAVAPDSKK